MFDRRPGFIWSNGKVDYFSPNFEHEDMLKNKFARKKNTPYIDFSFVGSKSIQLRVGHQLQMFEIRIINRMIEDYDLNGMVVDVWGKRSWW